MSMYQAGEIQVLPLGVPVFRKKLDSFLARNGLGSSSFDIYLAFFSADGEIIAGGGLDGDTIKCVAVDAAFRSEGLLPPVISRLMSEASQRGIHSLKVFTSPENEALFASLGFRTIGCAPLAVLMENGRGLEKYCDYLASLPGGGRTGVIVMNASPFTLGHRHLIEQSRAGLDRLVVIPVRDGNGPFSYTERRDMIRQACPDAILAEGSGYQISAATFPSYFIKRLSDVSETQMRLDIDIFCRHIAPALGADLRIVGTEPCDPLTARYNELLKDVLPSRGIQVRELGRLCMGGAPVSASAVRAALDASDYPAAASVTPYSTRRYLLAELAARALQTELDAPDKPGLVCPDSSGAHDDMDYTLMCKAVKAIRRAFPVHWDKDIVAFGKAVEADVLELTGGVNTHRGAIFALGLASRAEGARDGIAALAAAVPESSGSHGASAAMRFGAKGALAMARDGYRELYSDWLPFWRSVRRGPYAVQKTLLRIMCTLDDTCILHRAGKDAADEVKYRAGILLGDFTPEGLKGMAADFVARNISPGGSADMLALTVYIDSLIHEK